MIAIACAGSGEKAHDVESDAGSGEKTQNIESAGSGKKTHKVGSAGSSRKEKVSALLLKQHGESTCLYMLLYEMKLVLGKECPNHY